MYPSTVSPSGTRNFCAGFRVASSHLPHKSTLFMLHPTLPQLQPLEQSSADTTLTTLNPSLHTLHPTPYLPQPTPHTLHTAPSTLHPAHYTLHPALSPLHPGACTLETNLLESKLPRCLTDQSKTQAFSVWPPSPYEYHPSILKLLPAACDLQMPPLSQGAAICCALSCCRRMVGSRLCRT